MSSTITDLEKITLTVAELNSIGQPVPFVEIPQWASSVPSVAQIDVSEDGAVAVVTSLAAGTTRLTVTVDSLTGLYDVTVTSSPGVQLFITPGLPEPK